MRSIFRRSKLHRKFVGQRHGAIAVLVREVGGRSDLRNDRLPRVVERTYIAPSLCFRIKSQNLFGRLETALTHGTHSPFRLVWRPSQITGVRLFAEVRDERMQRRLFTERSHAESRAVTPPALRAFAASQRDARALHEAGGKLRR